jgi:hypothetical protein
VSSGLLGVTEVGQGLDHNVIVGRGNAGDSSDGEDNTIDKYYYAYGIRNS